MAVRKLFIVTAVIELGAGFALMFLPSQVLRLALGVVAPALEALIMGRLGGVGLFALGIAFWLARDDNGSRAQKALLWGITFYNAGACIVLALAEFMLLHLAGIALWLAMLLHVVLLVWCAVNLRVTAVKS
ncbi:MAG: hypothetical protein V2B19_22315 [Pseudomonadota bacterium]